MPGANLTERQVAKQYMRLQRLKEEYLRKYEMRLSYIQKWCPHKPKKNENLMVEGEPIIYCFLCGKELNKDIYKEHDSDPDLDPEPESKK